MKTIIFLLVTVVISSLPIYADKPAVLFTAGLHPDYVAKPLHAMGIEFHSCQAEEIPERLASGKYNVVVVSHLHAAQLAALDAFMDKGGSVLACSPKNYPDHEAYTLTSQWLTAHGARPRWEMLQENDKQKVVTDIMGMPHAYSEEIAAPFKEGVTGILTLLARSTTGSETPMSFDLSDAWQVIARGTPTMMTSIDPRNDVHLAPWIPAEGIASAPPLLAVRQVQAGRLAVLAPRYYWFFASPPNCPTTEVMLTKGAGEFRSDWLRLLANTMRYLAEPSMQADLGGITTPKELLDPPPALWAKAEPIDWANHQPDFQPRPQHAGLVGARTALSSGSGTVADYVREAKAAGLHFIVFLEDSLQMEQAGWDELVAQCKALSDGSFAAIPGLTYEDAQGNHLFAFADQVRFPKPEMLLPDKRLATTQQMRSRAYFDYVNEYMSQQILSGLWNHDKNFLKVVDYKLYNAFPIKSFLDGVPVDDHLADYLYLQGIGGGQGALAFELMSSPEQVQRRAAEGWRVIVHRPLEQLDGAWHRGVFSFSGSGSQYITNGPRILTWDAPNRLCDAHGEWWRPDRWQWRIVLNVAAEAGLKTVTIHDGDRRILRRWQFDGETAFQHEIVLTNAQQLAPTLIVEDTAGKQAISMAFWSRNLLKEEFICTDRCNFLGNSRLRSRQDGQQWTSVGFMNNMGITPSKGRIQMLASPALALNRSNPTLPIDGRPAGLPTAQLNFDLRLPGEHPDLFAWPQTILVSPDIGIGQADILLAYDPAELDATETPLGHAYTGRQVGWGNAWGSWHRLVPTQIATGWQRMYAGNWIPDTFRFGWHETRVTLREAITWPADRPGQRIMHAGMSGWQLYRGDQAIEPGDGESIAFERGSYVALAHAGGSVLVFPASDNLHLLWRRGGTFELYYHPGGASRAAGETLDYRVAFAGAPGDRELADLVAFAASRGAFGEPAYRPTVTQGSPLDTYLTWDLDGAGSGIAATMPKVDLQGFLMTRVQNLNDRWSAWLVDRNRPFPNFRGVPVAEGTAYAGLDPFDHDLDIYLGHPVIADQPELIIDAAWQASGSWRVEAHNPTEQPIEATLSTPAAWPLFTFRETVTLAPGTSRVWQVATTEP